MLKFDYESMGTRWEITCFDVLMPETEERIKREVIAMSDDFDALYSRFKPESLVSRLSKLTGVFEVPEDLVNMLRVYEKFYKLTDGKLNPLVGNTISDLGYDSEYSLREKNVIRLAPDYLSVVKIISGKSIELKKECLIDLGALGKGYFVDRLALFLRRQGVCNFLVNGGGDVFYEGMKPIRAGLEHPLDVNKVIGVIELKNGALCASGVNRRVWGRHHHIVDPHELSAACGVLASWVVAKEAAVADGVATALFLADPEMMWKEFEFEYCVLNEEMRVKKSEGFNGQFY